jgi:hypothetical protein
MAWLAPWAMNGTMGWAASPSKVTRSRVQRSSGRRSYGAHRLVQVAARMSRRTRSSQPENSAARSSTRPSALQDSAVQSPAGTQAAMLTSLPAETG